MVIEQPTPSGLYNAHDRKHREYRKEEPLTYPKAIYFILAGEFFERVTYYGMSIGMLPFLENHFLIEYENAIIINNVFLMFSSFFPLLGALVSDCWLNKFKTIMYTMPVYLVGTMFVVVSTLPNVPGIPIAMTGLVLAYLGIGGMRPNIVSLGGDQFVRPQQESYLKKYFSAFYFAIKMGSFVADVSIQTVSEKRCFGRETCFFAGLCIACFSLVCAGVVLFAGKRFYHIREPDSNVIVKMFRCIFYALKKGGIKVRRSKKQNTGHWLDVASDKFDPAFINDVKIVLRIALLFVPLPFFRALFDQHGSRWFAQAARMSGDIGKLKLEAEQMHAVNSVFILLFIPLFEAFLYPALAKYNFLKKPLQRLTVGGLLAAMGFLVSALVEIQLEPTDEYGIRPGEAQFRFYNGLPDPLSINIIAPPYGKHVIQSLDAWSKLDIPTKKKGYVKIVYSINGTQRTDNFKVFENSLVSYLVMPQKVVRVNKEDSSKSKQGFPKVKIIYVQPAPRIEVVTYNCETETTHILTQDKPYIPYEANLDCDRYRVERNGKIIYQNDDMAQGGVYVGFIMEIDGVIRSNTLVIVQPNSVHMLWLVPQYVLITAGEVMFSITGFEFSYTQAPVSMKAFLQAAWLMTAALGKVIVLIAGSQRLSRRLFTEFMLFAALMTVDMFVFAVLAMRYKYVEVKKEGEQEPGQNK